MKVLAIIPARYGSTRFPGKPLVDINGKPMIRHVYENASKIEVISHLVVATDDERIENAVLSFGGNVMITSSEHQSGTDRCNEVVLNLQKQGQIFDIVINIQGDEPFVDASQIEDLVFCFRKDPMTEIATLKKQITDSDELFSPNVVKVVTDVQQNAIYFSRNPIPYLRGNDRNIWIEKRKYYKHIGIYAYSFLTLQKVVTLSQSGLEVAESLEQLRWIENGYKIKVAETFVENISVDTPEDLLKIKHTS